MLTVCFESSDLNVRAFSLPSQITANIKAPLSTRLTVTASPANKLKMFRLVRTSLGKKKKHCKKMKQSGGKNRCGFKWRSGMTAYETVRDLWMDFPVIVGCKSEFSCRAYFSVIVSAVTAGNFLPWWFIIECVKFLMRHMAALTFFCATNEGRGHGCQSLVNTDCFVWKSKKPINAFLFLLSHLRRVNKQIYTWTKDILVSWQ